MGMLVSPPSWSAAGPARWELWPWSSRKLCTGICLKSAYSLVSGGKGHGGMGAASAEQKGAHGVESSPAPFVVE